MTFDPGLQPERTALAWTRTSLSLMVGGGAGVKGLSALIGGPGLAVGIALTGAGALLALAAHRRSERVHAALVAQRGELPDGRLLLAVATTTSVVAGVSVIAVARLAAGA